MGAGRVDGFFHASYAAGNAVQTTRGNASDRTFLCDGGHTESPAVGCLLLGRSTGGDTNFLMTAKR